MKTKKQFSMTAVEGGMDAAVSNNNEVFAKQKLQRIKLTWNLNRDRRSKVHLLMSILFAIAMTTVIGFSFIACEEECDCNPKAHLGMNESCTNCAKPNCGECTEQTGSITGTSITIRKQSGISVADMNTTITNIQAGYSDEGLSTTRQDHVKANVSQIYVVDEENKYSCDADGNGKFIITLDRRFNSATVAYLFEEYTNEGGPLNVSE
jgi:hypothetical protein